MKRLILAITILATATACFLALSSGVAGVKQRIRVTQNLRNEEQQRLAELQPEQGRLVAELHDLQADPATQAPPLVMQPALAEFLSTNEIKNASSEMQEKILAALGPGSISSASYLFVTKDALRNSRLNPLKSFPNSAKLTDSVRGVLSITADEQPAVETAFANAFERVASWAKANLQRDGPSNNMVVRYTIPVDQSFERASTEKLFSEIKAAIGEERSQLLENDFQHNRVYEDGAIGSRTNILEIHHISRPPGLGYRAGWKWENSEAINTNPEPITTNRFPAAFYLVFPGGWGEIAEKENFELPEKLRRKP